jgi:hypothetical protein
MKHYLLSIDIKSGGKGGKLYGKAGDKVLLIASHVNVMIVKGKENFPVHIDNLKEI